MNILGTQYTLEHKAYEIYLSGCAHGPHCEGCHNPESWDFNAGEPLDREKYISIVSEIKQFDKLIQNIWILGGEPLDQDKIEFIALLESLRKDVPLCKIWIFTGYMGLELPEKFGIENKHLVDYIKCGTYISKLSSDNHVEYGVKLATTNQHIYKIDHGGEA